MKELWRIIRNYFLGDPDYVYGNTAWCVARLRKLQNWDENACKALVKWEKR